MSLNVQKSGTIGVAISDTQLTAVYSSQSGRVETRVWELNPYTRLAGEWPSLAEALQELRGKVGDRYKKMAISILPPLMQVRRVELPRVQGVALRMLLSRNASKYFPAAREPFTVGANLLADGSPAPYLAAGLPARLLDTILRTVNTSLWEVETVVPAHAAWYAAATDIWKNLSSASDFVAAQINSHYEVLEIEGGKVVGVRRYLMDEVPGHQKTHLLKDPIPLAAQYAAAARKKGPEVLPESEFVKRANARNRIVRWAGVAAAAVLVMVCAGVYVDAKRDLRAVLEERARLRATVAEVMDGQTDIAALSGPVSVLEKIEKSSTVWSEVFVDFGTNLPNDSYITTFRGRGDSLSADGFASKGAAVFEAMNGAKLIDSIRSAGPIRRQARNNAARPLDQFTLAGQIPDAVPLFAPRGRNQR